MKELAPQDECAGLSITDETAGLIQQSVAPSTLKSISAYQTPLQSGFRVVPYRMPCSQRISPNCITKGSRQQPSNG